MGNKRKRCDDETALNDRNANSNTFLMALAASAPLPGGGRQIKQRTKKKKKKERTSEFIPNVDGTSTVTWERGFWFLY